MLRPIIIILDIIIYQFAMTPTGKKETDCVGQGPVQGPVHLLFISSCIYHKRLAFIVIFKWMNRMICYAANLDHFL